MYTNIWSICQGPHPLQSIDNLMVPRNKTFHKMIHLKLLMFFSCASLAPTCNYLGLQYLQMGFAPSTITILLSLPPFLSLLSFNIFMKLLQNFGLKNLVLLLSLTGWSAFSLLCISSSGKPGLLAYVYATFASVALGAIGQYVDTLTIQILGKRKDLYGQQRLWASLGWAFSSYISGLLIDTVGNGDTSRVLVWIEALFMSGFISVVYMLPNTVTLSNTKPNIMAMKNFLSKTIQSNKFNFFL